MRPRPARLGALAALLCLPLLPARAAELHFCWRGNAGYTMAGTMRFPDPLLAAEIVTEADLTGFEIAGYRHGTPVGRWSLDQLTPDTSWLLRFDPQEMRFPMPGFGVFQAWNANGAVDDCGDPGFGFNAGNGGQDVCVDGRFVSESTIPWQTPLHATSRPVAPDCGGPMVLSRARN